MYDCIVLGGGHNGLVYAAYMARAGRKVLVLERRHVLGGAAVTEEVFPGFRFSVCSGNNEHPVSRQSRRPVNRARIMVISSVAEMERFSRPTQIQN